MYVCTYRADDDGGSNATRIARAAVDASPKEPPTLMMTTTISTTTSTSARVSHRTARRDVSTAALPRVAPRPLVAALVAASLSLTDVDVASAKDASVFAGEYYDPNHPGCPRSIDAKGVVRGLDPVPFKRGRGCRGVKKSDLAKTSEKFKAWSIKSKISGDEIFIDFNQKDGSGEKVTGKWTGSGIALPDGTVWKKKTDSQAWTPR